MSGDVLELFVRGVPAPQGSKRHVGNGRMVESSTLLPAWRADLAYAAEGALQRGPWDSERCFSVSMVFYLPRPKSSPKSRLLPDRKPDLDKLVRAVLDGLTHTIWADDARVTDLHACKVFASDIHPVGVAINVVVDE